jgi:PhnB protein
MPDRPLSEQLDQTIDAILTGAKRTTSEDTSLAGLINVAGRLRDLPDDGFRASLRREFSAPMESAATEYATIYTITPFIGVPEGDKLIDFMEHAFGADETDRHPHHGPDGFVAGVRIGDSDIIIMGGQSMRGQECPAALHVYVNDCDAAYQRALERGASPIGPPDVSEPADRSYGERAAFVSDPFGNYWFIATRFGRTYVNEGLGNLTPSLLPRNTHARQLLDFLKRGLGAQVEDLHEEDGRIVHAFVQVGEAVVEMAETEETLPPCGLYLHTDNVDAIYHRAIAEGATPILPPADQPFGDRLAIFQDPAGNRWFAAKRIL